MASDGKERKLVFDTRGRRRHVVKFVYAILALLMGASLFLVTGAVNLNSLFGNNGSVTSAVKVQEEQTERIEQKLRKNPEDENALLALTRAQINTGNVLATANSEGAVEYTPESKVALENASETWTKYLKAAEKPNSGTAQLVAQAQFTLAQLSRTGPEAESNIRAAAAAQQIVADALPSLGSLSTLAIYKNYAFDFKGAEKAEAEALKHSGTKFERENLENELEATKKRAHEFQKELAKIAKEAEKAQSKGEPSLANPLSENNPLASP
jgi:hypothetical protein